MPGFPTFVELVEEVLFPLFLMQRLVSEVEFFPLVGQALFDVVHKTKPTAGSLDGWGWRELNCLPLAWFDCLAVILSRVELGGTWPEGALDAYIAMIPKVDGDCIPLGQKPLWVVPVVYRLWASVQLGSFSLGCLIRSSSLVGSVALLRPGC